jgi:hypothetical protein
MSRGFDCNNPMDLEVNEHFCWQGEIRPTTDPSGVLCDFDTPISGLRAGALDLYNQQALHSLNTWTEVITKYAPPSENDTEAYIAAMCAGTGVGPNDQIDLSDPSFLAKACHLVIIQEQGKDPYINGEVEKAISTFLPPAQGATT